MKNITIISHNYYPEDVANGFYNTQMAEYLSQNHKVRIITGYPYYPKWEIFEAYRNKPSFSKEKINEVEVFRFKQYTPQEQSFSKRIFQMVHFFIGSLRNVWKQKEADIIIVVLPFTLSILLGFILRWRTKGKVIVHIQDFEFDAALQSGFSSNAFLKKMILRFEKWLFDASDAVSTISNGMLQRLSDKSDTPQIYFPNWIDANTINPAISTKHPYSNGDKFTILYSGNIGEKQDWNFFIEVVKRFENQENIQFVLVGDGAKRKDIVEALEDQENLVYYPPVPYSELNDLLCSADLHVLFQKTEVIDTVMPSKILSIFASSKPFIITGNKDSEVKKHVEESQGGYYFSDGDVDTVVSAINAFVDGKETLTQNSKARDFIIERFAYENVLSQFEKDIIELDTE